ncbi:hypothetical protein C8R31_101277 [Nitrosospira sp. Nsp2]|nr:hypothetical protein C8R31_101277 [Nitrosospira sp. Nsp2]
MRLEILSFSAIAVAFVVMLKPFLLLFLYLTNISLSVFSYRCARYRSYFCVHDNLQKIEISFILIQPILSIYWGNSGFILSKTLSNA